MATFNAVFEGGGAKGIVFLGALEAIEAHGHGFGQLVGTSAGAISATLVAAGYNAADVRAAMSERTVQGKPVFSTFMDHPTIAAFPPELRQNSRLLQSLEGLKLPGLPDLGGGLFSLVKRGTGGAVQDALLGLPLFRQLCLLVERGGVFSGDVFVDWMGAKLAAKGLDRDVTLADLATRAGRKLSLLATDTDNQRRLVLTAQSAPRLPVRWGVRMSMSIPFVWQEVLWRREWGNYDGADAAGIRIVDGGLLSNFPIDLLPEGDSLLGLLIDEKLPVAGQPAERKKKQAIPELATLTRVHRLLDTLLGARDNEHMRRLARFICRLPAAGYDTLEFDMDHQRRDDLVAAGRAAMEAHLASRFS